MKPHRFAPFSAGALRRWRAPCAGTLASRARGTRSAAGWRPAFRSHSAALQSVPVKQKKKVTKHSWIDTKISSLTMIPSWIELKKKKLGFKTNQDRTNSKPVWSKSSTWPYLTKLDNFIYFDWDLTSLNDFFHRRYWLMIGILVFDSNHLLGLIWPS